ncbi:Erythroferrone [Manis pentadactyla]|nr:Erythroferrone [Manis pentadactyla]
MTCGLHPRGHCGGHHSHENSVEWLDPVMPSSGHTSTDREVPLGATLPSYSCGGQQRKEDEDSSRIRRSRKAEPSPCTCGPGPWSPSRMEGQMLLSLHKYLMDVVFGKAGGGRLGQGLSLSQGGRERVGRAERVSGTGVKSPAPCTPIN